MSRMKEAVGRKKRTAANARARQRSGWTRQSPISNDCLKGKEKEMDTGKGRFEMVNAKTEDELKEAMQRLEAKYPEHRGWFRVGEIVELHGSRFRVKAVKPNELRLKLLPRE